MALAIVPGGSGERRARRWVDMAGRSRSATLFAALALTAAGLVATAGAGAAQPTCFGRAATIVAQAGQPTEGTPGADVIVGTSGDDRISGRGGDDLICALGGDDVVRGGRGADQVDLGAGADVGRGGSGSDLILGGGGADILDGNRGHDTLRGNGGADTLSGNGGRDRLRGDRGIDTCDGGGGRDTGARCERVASLTERLDDSFAGTGSLRGYTTNNPNAVPEVGRFEGRYLAPVTDNADNITLHFNEDQGRLDAKLVEFPFDIVVRNIGIGTLADSQTPPSGAGNPYIFAGVQVHVPDLDDRTSSHVVVGHRGSTHFTIEGKNTVDGDSTVDDDGADIAPAGRADIRVVGSADRTLTVSWQTPRAAGQADDWTPYRGTGRLPGLAPGYPGAVYVGLITYAFGSQGLPFVGTADAIEAG